MAENRRLRQGKGEADNESMPSSENESNENEVKDGKTETNWINSDIAENVMPDRMDSKQSDNEERAWIEKVFLSQIEEIVNQEPKRSFMSKVLKKSDANLVAECSIFQEYLQQQMMCSKTICKEEDDSRFVFSGCNYKTSVPNVIHHFIHPRGSKDQVLVLPPNFSTLDAMDEILASDGMLRKAANLVDHSLVYLQYLLGFTGKNPKCVSCSKTGDSASSFKEYQAKIDSMKSNLIVPAEDMKKSATVEAIFPALQLKECCCDRLVESKVTVDLLTKRFLAFFFWPCVLSSVGLTKSQSSLMSRRKCYQRRKQKRKKRDDEDSSEDEDASKKKYPKQDSEKSEADEENPESESPSRSAPKTTVERNQSSIQDEADEFEEIELSDTPEDFS